MRSVKGANDTRRRRAQRHRNGHAATPPYPPCTCAGPCDHGTTQAPPPPPPPPERYAPPCHPSSPRSPGCAALTEDGAMDGRPPPPPRSFGPSPPRHQSGPPSVGRGVGQPFMDGGRPPTRRRLPYPPHPRRIGPDADKANPDDRRVRRRVNDNGGHHPRASDDYPRRWSPPRRSASPPRGPP